MTKSLMVYRLIAREPNGEWKVVKTFPDYPPDSLLDSWLSKLEQYHPQVFYQQGPEHKLHYPQGVPYPPRSYNIVPKSLAQALPAVLERPNKRPEGK